jgi:hypothetical protein
VVNQTFNELNGSEAPASRTYFNWYDNVNFSSANIHRANPSALAATRVTYQFGTGSPTTISIVAGGSTNFSSPSSFLGGPVLVTGDGAGVIATIRSLYSSSFNETPAFAGPLGASNLWFTWGDRYYFSDDNFHFTNPTPSSVTATLSVGAYSCSVSISAGGVGYCPMQASTIGGPVSITATGRILASERQVYQGTFHEVNAASYP